MSKSQYAITTSCTVSLASLGKGLQLHETVNINMPTSAKAELKSLQANVRATFNQAIESASQAADQQVKDGKLRKDNYNQAIFQIKVMAQCLRIQPWVTPVVTNVVAPEFDIKKSQFSVESLPTLKRLNPTPPEWAGQFLLRAREEFLMADVGSETTAYFGLVMAHFSYDNPTREPRAVLQLFDLKFKAGYISSNPPQKSTSPGSEMVKVVSSFNSVQYDFNNAYYEEMLGGGEGEERGCLRGAAAAF